MRFLVTGGCGFIGLRLIQHLLKVDGRFVRVVDNLSNGAPEKLEEIAPMHRLTRQEFIDRSTSDSSIQLIVGGIEDAELAQAACRDVDVIIHLAANTGVGPSVERPRADCMANVIGVFNYLDGARLNGVGRFVFASSSATVGQGAIPITETLPARPMSPYGASKLAGEGYCSAFFHSFGVQAVALRFGNVYGPGSSRKESVVAKVIRRTLAGETFEVYGDGGQTRDFIYVDDLVEAIERAYTAEGIGGEVFQIASAQETTVSELLGLLRREFIGRGLAAPNVMRGAPRTADVQRSFSDTSKAKARLGWQARVPLAQGLGQTLDWFLARAKC